MAEIPIVLNSRGTRVTIMILYFYWFWIILACIWPVLNWMGWTFSDGAELRRLDCALRPNSVLLMGPMVSLNLLHHLMNN